MKGRISNGAYLLILPVIVLIGLLVWGDLPFLDPLSSALGQEPEVTSSEVVDKLRSAGYLTTTKYKVQVIAKDDTPGGLFGFGSHKMLLFSKGTVEAGIDLAQIKPANVDVSEGGKNITVTLPPVTIHRRDYSLSQKADDTYVTDISTGLFAETSNVQTELRSKANEEVVKSACKADIMRRATLDAKIVTEELLKTLLPNVKVIVLSGDIPTVKECINPEEAES